MGDKEEGRAEMWPPAAPAVMQTPKTPTFLRAASCWPARSTARASPFAVAAISMDGKGCRGGGSTSSSSGPSLPWEESGNSSKADCLSLEEPARGAVDPEMPSVAGPALGFPHEQ
jgi:hypothetical protein